MTLESDRLRIAMLLTQHVRIEGIAEMAEAFAQERALLMRLLESAQRHLGSARDGPGLKHFEIATLELDDAVRLLREGKVPAELMEGAG